MKDVRTLCVLLICVVLCTSGAAYPQARPGTSALPGTATNSGVPDEPSVEEMAGSTPCGQRNMEAAEDTRLPDYDNVAWEHAARVRICIESVRSDAVALAWAQGLDEHGVPLDAKASASRLTEMEGWLRRLVGKFRIEGKRWKANRTNVEVVGTADCFRIGDGPGVSCLISADWRFEEKNGNGKNPEQFPDVAIRPQVLLFGLDPVAMEIRVTHVDSIAVEMHGILRDGAAILSEQSPPEVSYYTPPDVRDTREWFRESLIAMSKDRVPPPRPKTIHYQTPLSGISPDDDGNSPRRLSRIAMTQEGEVDMKFYVFLSTDGILLRGNQPIEFDLQLHREPRIAAKEKGPAVVADFTCAKPTGSAERQAMDEAEEARAGVKKESGTRQMQAWLARLVGQYSVEGNVDPCGQGNPADQRPVTGKLDCISAGSPPSVHCKVNVSWPPATRENDMPLPSGVSNLAPAQFLFSLFTVERFMIDPFPVGGRDKRGIHLLKLDNLGIAEGASGELVGDTFMARENCVDIPGDCHKITRVTARSGSNEISMQVDVEMNRKRVLRQTFLMRRKSEQSGTSLP